MARAWRTFGIANGRRSPTPLRTRLSLRRTGSSAPRMKERSMRRAFSRTACRLVLHWCESRSSRPGGWLIAQYRLPLTFDSARSVCDSMGRLRALATMDVEVGKHAFAPLRLPGRDRSRSDDAATRGSPGHATRKRPTFALVIGRVSAAVVASLSTHLDFRSQHRATSTERHSLLGPVDGANQTCSRHGPYASPFVGTWRRANNRQLSLGGPLREHLREESGVLPTFSTRSTNGEPTGAA